MTNDEFSDLLLTRDYVKAEKALKQGFNPNKKIDGRPPLEWSSFSDDYRMMEILWKAGAKPTTPYTKEIVNEFKAGKTWKNFITKAKKSEKKLPNLTRTFSIKKLELNEGRISQGDVNTYSISIPIAPFILNGDEVKTSIELYGIEFKPKLKALAGKTISFPINPAPGYIDGSIYIRNAHVPVDVTKIKIKSVAEDKVNVTIVADFLFEIESTGFKNEKIEMHAVLAL